MNTSDQSDCRMIILTACPEASDDYLNRAATLIRVMPPVLRVRVHFAQRQLEVLTLNPAPGLLAQVHRALSLAGTGTLVANAD